MKKRTVAFIGAVWVVTTCGCSMGMQPEGPNAEQVKAKEASLPPDQQIAMIKYSPMPAAQKAEKIAEVKAKYGIK